MKSLIKKILKEETSQSSFEKIKKIVLDMYQNHSYSYDDILGLVGISKEVLILCLMNEPLVEQNCNSISIFLYDLLINSDFIEKGKHFDDGSKINFEYTSFGGVLEFTYIDKTKRIYTGLGTFLWDGDCYLPIDILYFEDEKESIDEEINYTMDSDYSYNFLRNDPEFKNIKTLKDIIDYFNKKYFTILKTSIDNERDYIYSLAK